MQFSPSKSKFDDKFPSIEYEPPDRPFPKDGTFEIGLCLAGGTSAGTYVAGVLDFLFEALDTWQMTKEAEGSNVPSHQVVIRVISGTSAGGINGAIAAAALGRDFPHVDVNKTEVPKELKTGNPFFDSWVNGIDSEKLLDTRDLEGKKSKIVSLLDATGLNEIATQALVMPKGAKRKTRTYFSNPLRLFLTTTNLCGVPFLIPFKGNTEQGYGMRMHRDHVRFSIDNPGGIPAQGAFDDELELNPPGASLSLGWSELALATGAFPLALKPRNIKREDIHYKYRNVAMNHPSIPKKLVRVSPATSPQESYDFAAVDGGVMNNEPLELARQVLAGALGHNRREGDQANRATILIDSFPGMPKRGSPNAEKLTIRTAAMGLINAWLNDSRFRAQDLALAMAGNIYSRFLIAPSRGNKGREQSNNHNLASEALNSFGGFLEREYRVHDYLLGRYNCQRFLSEHFVLPKDNQLFHNWRKNETLVNCYLVNGPNGTPKDHLPIIPLVKGCTVAQKQPRPNWPSEPLVMSSLEEKLTQRFNRLYDVVSQEKALYYRVGARLVRPFVRNKFLTVVKKKITDSLNKMNLQYKQ